jgi:hypothetical protein
MRTRGILMMVVTICALALMCPLASAQAGEFPAPPYLSSPWKFSLEPYLWLPAMTGDITVRGHTADVDLDLGDVFEALLDSFQFGAMGRFEARKGNLLFTLDVLYTDLEDDNTTARGLAADVTSQTWIVEFGAGYRLGTWPLSLSVYPALSFDFLAGGRYVAQETGLEISGGPLGGVDVERDVDWIEPFVGGRLLLTLSQRIRLAVRGDVGGFGVGAELTWNLVGNVQYYLSRTVSLSTGYRALSIDYEQGSGTDRFRFNVIMHGPVLGAVFHF